MAKDRVNKGFSLARNSKTAIEYQLDELMNQPSGDKWASRAESGYLVIANIMKQSNVARPKSRGNLIEC